MPRPPRIQFEGACYHVYHRGNRRERIFWDDADYATFEEHMLEAMRWSGVLLFDWSLLPNHFHLFVGTPDGNLSEFMQRLLTRYAKYFNWSHKKVGHVFQGRYGARVCEKESYFMELVRYVELNSYRLKKGKLAELGSWKWASLRYLLGSEETWPEGCQTAFRRVLERFGQDPAQARKGLMEFLADGLASGTWEDFDQAKGNRFLGSETFVERVKQAIKEPVRRQKRELKRLRSVQELLAEAEACFGVSPEELVRAGKERRYSRIRQAVVEIARTRYRIPVTRLAEALRRSESAISMTLRRGWRREAKSEEMEKLLTYLERPLGQGSQM